MSDFILTADFGSATRDPCPPQKSDFSWFPWDVGLVAVSPESYCTCNLTNGPICFRAQISPGDGWIQNYSSCSSVTKPDFTFAAFGWIYDTCAAGNNISLQKLLRLVSSLRQRSYEPLSELSGTYTLVVLEHATSTVWVVPDRWAIRSVAFAKVGNCISVSSKAAAVAHVINASIDGTSLVSLLRGAKAPIGRSLFEGVHRLCAGQILRFDAIAQCAEVIQTRRLTTPSSPNSLRDAAVEASRVYSHVLRRAVEHNPIMLDLTGGHDTRLTVSALTSRPLQGLSRQLQWRVVDSTQGQDALVAKRIAAQTGLSLQISDRHLPLPDSWDLARSIAILLDGGEGLHTNTVRGLWRDLKHFGEFRYLLGSLGGELWRDYFWRHEVYRVGREKVDFDSLMKHRLYMSSGFNPRHVIKHCDLTLEEHDQRALEPYRVIDQCMTGCLNVQKLDVMYLHKLACSTIFCWTRSPLYSVLLPLLSGEMLEVVLGTHWKHRMFRRLQLWAFWNLNPALCSIPTDAGWPTTPLRLATCLSHSVNFGRDLARNLLFRSHRRGANSGAADPMPASWLGATSNNDAFIAVRSLFTDLAERASCPGLLNVQLALSALLDAYPRIQPKVSFDGLSPAIATGAIL